MKDEPNIDELKKKLRKNKNEDTPKIEQKKEIKETESIHSSDNHAPIQQEENDYEELDGCVIEHYKDNDDKEEQKENKKDTESEATSTKDDSDSIELNETQDKIEVTELTSLEPIESEEKSDSEPENIEKKPKKKRNINYKKWSIILFSATIIFLVASYLISSKSDVKEIVVNGNEHLSTEEILERSEIKEKDKMYLISEGKAEQNISLLPIVESITVERDFPNTVNITVKEFDVVAYVESKGRYYPVLENEQILRGFDMTPTDAPIIHFFDGVEFEGMVKSLKQMNPQILAMISEIFYRPNEETNSRIQLYMNDGQEIVADYNTIGDKIDYYAGMKKEIGNKKGLIDLEVSNTFLPYSSEEVVRIKQSMRSVPRQVPYIEEIEASLEDIKRSLKALEIENEE
ncbi:MAG TPA: FtsQ-type POTRA domain-containing protein [Jeotgalicoccus sp.]|nr:FtsQ-type POTRA domain-containing protein [Jeotgalicoccus sp.]